MNRRVGSCAVIGALALPAALAGCDPAPEYGPQVAPYVGVTYAEESVVATGLAQSVKLFFSEEFAQYQVVLSLPEGAYPSGTTVIMRVAVEDQITVPSGDAVGLEPFLGRPAARQEALSAVQVLPVTPAPALPLTLGLLGYGESSYDVLHATEGDAAWQVIGTVQAVAIDDRKRSLSLIITGPGLWTLGQPRDVTTPVAAETDCLPPFDEEGR